MIKTRWPIKKRVEVQCVMYDESWVWHWHRACWLSDYYKKYWEHWPDSPEYITWINALQNRCYMCIVWEHWPDSPE